MLIIKIVNVSGTNESSNYLYRVMVNDRVIEIGEVKGHDRTKGWQDLVEMLVDESRKKNNLYELPDYC